ncbi:uncharacterized protein LOC141654985 [Silene latifolia]|uniref:uncharacterized protein LOC141654985 n=1 Tax=Silene latifolia TaxID=37657 RepID=UPI003D76C0B0
MVDREWMYNRLDEDGYLRNEFVAGVDTFIKYACNQENFKQYPLLKCPCSNCWNKPYMEVDSVKLHLYKNGYRDNYSCWSCHGETYIEAQSSSAVRSQLNPYRDMVMDSYVPISEVSIDEGLEDGEEPPNQQARRFFDMLKNAEKPLYDGCKKSLLSMASRMINLKCEFNIPHRAIDGFASFVKEACPDNNLMTESFYATRKLVKGLELPHIKIDVCREGCVLFWNENAHLEKCGSCDAERFKKKANGKLIPEEFMIYFPITARLQRLYAAKSTASYMSWHSEYPQNNETMSHPRDGEAWKHFDATYPDFAAEPRNVRLGLCTDGFNPFGKFGNYSCWPVILAPYNLPPLLCMKRQTLFLSMIIPGPKNPKGKLDVYLQPLVEELKHLWNVGAITYDASKKRNFNMKAALLWTISDFPAYGMLSGWSTAGRLACPYCMEKSKSFYLKHSQKQTWFDCHRPFLHPDHVFRNNKSSFVKNKVDHSTPPPRLDGEDIWKRVSDLPKATEYNHSCEKSAKHNWTKQSILWELPYWSKLLIRHNLDVMHIEKNFFDQLINTIMDVKGKTKDTKKTRKDLAVHCKRRKLHLHDNSKETMPHAPFVLSKEKRKVLCKWVTKSEHIKTDLIKTLAIGPYKSVRRYDHYYINGYNFHTYSYGKNKATMNYGVCVRSLQGSNYYGILQDVFELVYSGETRSYKTILFKCDWFDSGNGTKVHPQYKLVEVNHTKKYSKYDPFVLAFQVQQVYFAPYPSLKKDKDCWWAVFPVKVRSTIDIPKVQIAFQEEVIDDPPLLSNPNDGMDEIGVRDGFEEAVLLDENDDDVQIELEIDEEDELLADNETSSDEFESDDFEESLSD